MQLCFCLRFGVRCSRAFSYSIAKNIDKVFEDNLKNFIILDKSNYIKQIVGILKNYDEYILIRNNCYDTIQNKDWDNWASSLCQYF